MLTYCQPKDIVDRMSNRNLTWYHGKPTIKLYSENGSFGKLQFNFGDRVFTSNIYKSWMDSVLDEYIN